MIENNNTIRDYSKADDTMLEQSQTMRNSFDKDQLVFAAMFPMFDMTFSDNWQDDIDSAKSFPTSDEFYMELKVKTADIDIQMERCRVHYQLMATYIKVLFNNSKAQQGVFGLHKYDRARKAQLKLYNLMCMANRKCNDSTYNTDLITLGFNQLNIDKLETLATALYKAIKARNDYMQKLVVNTEIRVATYNKVWDYMQKVSAASKQIFLDNYAKLEQYKLYPEVSGGIGKYKNNKDVVDPVDPILPIIDFDAGQDSNGV